MRQGAAPKNGLRRSVIGAGSGNDNSVMPMRGSALGMLLLCILAAEVRAEIYRWVDQAGHVHFTDDINQVPSEHRDGVERRPSTAPSALPPPPPDSSALQKRGRARESSPSLRSGRKVAKVIAVLDGDTIVISGGDKVRYGK